VEKAAKVEKVERQLVEKLKKILNQNLPERDCK
jgi:hypothetical protein